MKTFSVKNYSAFQHYRDRAPPWIKFYNRTLDDYEIGALPDAAKAHMFAIWMLASRYDNLIPYDQKFVERKINATTKIDLKLLEKSGFIVVNQECSNEIASLYQDASEVLVQRREEGEGEKKREDSSFEDSFEEFWRVYPKRKGANPKAPAKLKFKSALKDTPAQDIISAARQYGATIPDSSGREFIPMAQTWLSQCRFLDVKQEEVFVDPAMILAGRARKLKLGIQGLGSTLSSDEILELVREGHLTEEEGKRFST